MVKLQLQQISYNHGAFDLYKDELTYIFNCNETTCILPGLGVP